MEYYDLKRNWNKVLAFIPDPKVQKVLVRNLNLYTTTMWCEPFLPGMKPSQFECSDWRYGHRGKEPRFWKYVLTGACHWVVNFSLELAKRVQPKRSWRIISSYDHSSVWDGDETIFDFNWQASNIPADQTFETARHGNGGSEFPVGWKRQTHAPVLCPGERLLRDIHRQDRLARGVTWCVPEEEPDT